MPQHSTVKERVEYGLDTIPADRTVSVSLRDLLFIHQALGEFVQFFHQPSHFPDLAAVYRFLGSAATPDAFDVLREAYYRRLGAMIPADISEAFDDGIRFEHPVSPDYFTEIQPNASGDAESA
jgi:hypothetical protein